jgi:phosphatidyl-myo-inositol dimannoside synthase
MRGDIVNKEKRILILTHEFPPYPGGVGRYCWNLAAAAARAGMEVTVLAPEHGSRESDLRQDPPGVRVMRFPGDVFHFRELRRLEGVVRNAIDRGPWDVVHAADWPMIVAMRHLQPAVESTWIASLHGSDVTLLRRSLRARLSGAPTALTRFHRYVCNSSYTAWMLTGEFPQLTAADVRVAPLGVDPWWFETPREAEFESFASSIALRPGERVVLTVARLDTRKGHLATLAALAALPAGERSRVKYVCVGRAVDEAYRDRILAMAKACGVNTVLTGALPDTQVRAAYRTADVLALCGQRVPRKVEGFGLVLLEAAAQGLPAVVTRVQALPEVVKDGQTGWVCDEADSEGLVDAFATALTGIAKQGMRAACISHARGFSWNRCADETYEMSSVGPPGEVRNLPLAASE